VGNNTVARAIIADGSLLQGTGFIDSSGIGAGSSGTFIDVQAGGTVRPGTASATGILNIGGQRGPDFLQGYITFREDSILSFRLNGTTAGTDHDQLNLLGGVLTDQGVILDIDVGYTYTSSDLVFLARSALPLDGLGGYSDGETIDLFSGTDFWGTAKIAYFADFDTNSFTGGTDLALYDFAVIPEPATVAAILGALALGLAFWRRTRARARVMTDS
jgi:hypothetical protein